MKISFIPPNSCTYSTTVIVIECRNESMTFQDEDWIADELNTENWNRSDQVNSNKTYLFCIWQHWDVQYVHASKWYPTNERFERWILCFSLCVRFIWFSFKIAQVWLFCVYFSQTNYWPKLLTSRNMPFVTQTAVEIFKYVLVVLFRFPLSLLLYSKTVIIQRNDMAKIPCRNTTFITTKSHRMNNIQPNLIFHPVFSVHKWPKRTGFTSDKRCVFIHSWTFVRANGTAISVASFPVFSALHTEKNKTELVSTVVVISYMRYSWQFKRRRKKT